LNVTHYVVWGLDGPTFLGVYSPDELQEIFLSDASCPLGVLWVEPWEEPLKPPQSQAQSQQQYMAAAKYLAAATKRALRQG
jgi:hypothetical protein